MSDLRIHIDHKPYHSPNPTTGTQLYALGQIPAHNELFREVTGDHEDQLVPKDHIQVHLTQDEHFYSQKAYDLIINGKKKTVTTRRVTFDEIVKLAFDVPANETTSFTVTYRNGPPSNPEGSMVQGDTVKVKEGMVFSVTRTNKS